MTPLLDPSKVELGGPVWLGVLAILSPFLAFIIGWMVR